MCLVLYPLFCFIDVSVSSFIKLFYCCFIINLKHGKVLVLFVFIWEFSWLVSYIYFSIGDVNLNDLVPIKNLLFFI